MLIGTTVLLVALCACVVVVAPEDIPSYSYADLMLEEALAKLDNMLSADSSDSNDVSVATRNNALLIAVINSAAQDMVDHCRAIFYIRDYEDAYWDAVKTNMPEFEVNRAFPRLTQMFLADHTDLLLRKIYPISELITITCWETPSSKCDKAVDVIVKGDQGKYGEAADTLLDAGVLADLFLRDSYENLAENNEIPEMLQETDRGVIKLKYVINQLMIVKRHYVYSECYQEIAGMT